MRNPANASAAKGRWAEAGFKSKYILTIITAVISLCVPVSFAKEAVSKKILENGLVVLAKEAFYTDLVAINVKIGAGSRDEGQLTGSGLAHLVEHMVFKGTAKRNAGQIEEEIKICEAVANGAVSTDYTEFTMTVPAKHFARSMGLLKDMLTSAGFDEKEFVKEKEVIANEMSLKEDDPQSFLLKALYETSYMSHPYKHPVIGRREAFNGLNREDAVRFYEKMYVPNRMVIAIVGGIPADDALSVASSVWRASGPPRYETVAISPEPGQITGRAQTREIPDSLAYIAMGYHSTGLNDDDLFAMDVLSMILGRGDNSALTRILKKEKGLVYNVSSWNYTPRDPGLFVISAITSAENVGKTEREILDTIDRIKKAGIAEKELETAKRMVVGDYIFSMEPIEAQANDMAGSYLLTGTSDFSARYVEGVRSVTAAEVKRVMSRYLKHSNLSIIRLVPKGSAIAARVPAAPAHTVEIRSEKLNNGMRVVVRRKSDTPSVSMAIFILGGLMTEDEGLPGLANFTAQMMLKGSRSRPEDRITGYIESLGGQIDVTSGLSNFGIRVDVLSADVYGGLELLRDLIAQPTFPPDEIQKEKVIALARIKEEDDDIYGRGINILRRELFNRTPYANRIWGTAESIGRITREDLVKFHANNCVPQRMVISISGDVDIDKMIEDVKRLFGPLKGQAADLPKKRPDKLSSVKVVTLEMEREEALVLMGFMGIPASDPDRYAVETLSAVMSGMRGRLYDALRNEEGLSYALGSVARFGYETGYFTVYAATSKDRMDKAKSSLMRVIEDIRTKGAGEEELSYAKNAMMTEYKMAMQMNSRFATAAGLAELDGTGYKSVLDYPEHINAVSIDDVRRAANKYLDTASSVEILISPKWK